MAVTIGMVTLDKGHDLFKNNSFDDETEKFQINCSNLEAKQIMGMISDGTSKDYENIRIVNSKFSEAWGPLFIDTASGLVDNEDWKHSGWYLLRKADLELLTGKRSRLSCEVELLSSEEYEYFEMLYTPSFLLGTQNVSTFPRTTATVLFSDDFSTFNTTNWEDPVYANWGSRSLASDGSKMVFTGAAAIAGYPPAAQYITSKVKFRPPFEMIIPLEWVSMSVNYNAAFGVYLSTTKPSSIAEIEPSIGTLDFFRFIVYTTVKNTKPEWYAQQRKKKSYTTMASGTLETSQKTPIYRVVFDENGLISVYLNKGSGESQVVSNFKPDIDVSSGLYVTYHVGSKCSTSLSFKADALTVNRYGAVAPTNIVPLPVTTDYPDGLGTFLRASEDGSIPCVPNPSSQLTVGLDPTNFYEGCVKAISSNNNATAETWVTDESEIIDPAKFHVKNGIVKLITTSTGVKVQGWDGSQYIDIRTFTIGTCKILKLLCVNPEKVQFQFNKTKWTLHRGKRFAYVEHDGTDLSMPSSTYYYHDGASEAVSEGGDVSMSTQNYCLSKEASDLFGLIILKNDPTTIKTNKIPASSLTGIGMYDDTQAAESWDHHSALGQEFLNQPITGIGKRQI